MPPAQPHHTESIEGTIERIVYSNEESHYTVAQLLPEGRGRTDPVTIMGNLASVQVGESVRAQGRWTTHRQFGRQFVVEKFDSGASALGRRHQEISRQRPGERDRREVRRADRGAVWRTDVRDPSPGGTTTRPHSAPSLVEKAAKFGNAMALNEVAWLIVDPEMKIAKRDHDLAMKAAEKAVEATKGEDGAVLDTLARAHYWSGDLARAIEIQTKAVEKAAANPQMLPDLEATLDEYKAAAAAKKE